ncbi:MAG: hypothetical protein ACOY3P_05100 [Planctomycetota bacterium]
MTRSAMAIIVLWCGCTAGAHAAEVTDVEGLVSEVNHGAPGDTIQIAAGTYELSAPLVPRQGMTIRGAGAGKTVITAATAWDPGTAGLPKKENPSAYLFSFRKTSGVTIADMTLRGPKLHGAIFCQDCDRLELSHLRLEQFLWSGVRTFHMDGFKVHDCVFVDAGGKQQHAGGALYMHYTTDSEFWNNRITKTTAHASNFFGFKGRKGTGCRFHHNTVEVQFSFEFPFENDEAIEIDHNAFSGTISIPKHGGGPQMEKGRSFHVHHNWLRKSYALEWSRNGVEVDHNLFDFSPEDDGGNLVTNHGEAASPGPTHFHDNLIRNPGRGIFWSKGVYNNFHFCNNHTKGGAPARSEGLFGLAAASDFGTITIRDNIFELSASHPRLLMRNEAGYRAVIENNTLVHVTDAGAFANRDTGAPRGPREPLSFRCGAEGEYLVDGWEVSRVGP